MCLETAKEQSEAESNGNYYNYLFSFPLQIDVGLVLGNSQVAFEKAENSSLNLIGEFLHPNRGIMLEICCFSSLGDFIASRLFFVFTPRLRLARPNGPVDPADSSCLKYFNSSNIRECCLQGQ